MDKKETSIYIYIRHGEKSYSNGRGPKNMPQHDPPLLEERTYIIQNMGKELILKYGKPNIIVMSPYLRVQQTVEHLTQTLYENPEMAMEIDKNLYIDTNIAEFLGNQRGEIDLSEETLFDLNNNTDQLPQPGETKDQLRSRVEKHMDLLNISLSKMERKKPKVVWIISHGLVIQNVYDILKTYPNIEGITQETFYPRELGYFILKINDKNLNIEFPQRYHQRPKMLNTSFYTNKYETKNFGDDEI